jgi:abortive infection bacteriophage resistance protein
MEKRIYNKPAINVEKQIELLKSRKLIIGNNDFAKSILSNITYYRLSAYMKYFQSQSDNFIIGTTFEDILTLYNFDKDLKSLIFENIRIIEISLRAKICLHMCSNYGAHWFYSVNNFKNEFMYNKTLEIFKNEKELSKDTFIRYYFEKYSSPDLPPFWMITEVLSMGDLSKIMNGLNYKDIKQISKDLTPNFFTAPVITNWVHVLATIRNICAHHSRLWNRKLKIKFSKPQKIDMWRENNIAIDNVYSICFVIFLLLQENPYNEFEKNLKILFKKYNTIDITKMGFPKLWNGFHL